MKKSHKIIISILISLLVIITILAALGIGTFFSIKSNDNKPLFDIRGLGRNQNRPAT